MTDPDTRRRAIALYDDFTHVHGDRRALMRGMVALAGSAAAAEALIGSIAAAPAAAQIVPANDPRLLIETASGSEAGHPLTAYFAAPKAGKGRRGTVIVIHENRGLTPHIKDVARRVALAGFNAIAPDFLSPQGGTPADEDKAREMIGKADYDLVLAQATATLKRAKAQRGSTGKAGAVGFCWGGGLVNRLAVHAGDALDAGVSYYGPAPAASEAGKIRAAMLLQLAGNDARVNGTAIPWGDALRAAGKAATTHVYPGVEHAFNNDTSAERYDKAAADLAWSRTVAFLKQRLV